MLCSGWMVSGSSMGISFRVFEDLAEDKGIHHQDVDAQIQLFFRHGRIIGAFPHPFRHAFDNLEEQGIVAECGFMDCIEPLDGIQHGQTLVVTLLVIIRIDPGNPVVVDIVFVDDVAGRIQIVEHDLFVDGERFGFNRRTAAVSIFLCKNSNNGGKIRLKLDRIGFRDQFLFDEAIDSPHVIVVEHTDKAQNRGNIMDIGLGIEDQIVRIGKGFAAQGIGIFCDRDEFEDITGIGRESLASADSIFCLVAVAETWTTILLPWSIRSIPSLFALKAFIFCKCQPNNSLKKNR